jgi:putative inorganic carbon (hco3(-)) transporter
MPFVERTLLWQRAVLGAMLAAAAAGFWRGTFDVFNTFKATLVAVGVLALVTIGAVRIARTRRLQIPLTAAVPAVGAFAAALVVATAGSDTTMLSVVGRAGRHTGLVMYLAYAAILVTAVRLYRDRTPVDLVAWLLAAAVPVTLYGLLQAAGADPFPWQTVEGGPPVFSTFGNTNFFSGWLGMVVPLAVLVVLRSQLRPAWRAGAGVLAVAAFAAAVLSDSLQGPVVAVLGTGFVLAVLPSTTHGRMHELRRPLLGGGAAVALAFVTVVIAGPGPLGGVREAAAASLGTRTGKWQAALAMFRDHPLVGVGLDDFADFFHQYRPVAVAAQDGLRRTTDTPHNVPLDMVANGGLLLGATYLAVVVITGWSLVVGLRRLQGQERLLLAGLGGAWLAYQVQSLVSIDVPPLATLHWALAGTIIGFGLRPQVREVLLPGAPQSAAGRPARRRRAAAGVPLVPLTLPVAIAVGVVGVLGVAVLAVPLRADLAGAKAVHRINLGDVEGGLAAYQRAGDIAFWESRYPLQQGGVLLELGRSEEALAAFREAQAREPRSLNAALNVAQTSEVLGDEGARAAYEHLLELDPRTPDVLAEVGRYRLASGDAAGATDLLERAVTLRGDNARWWVVLGEARQSEGDPTGAREAFERALDLDPQVPGAREGLERMA